jgi:hypothetical protein
MSKTWTAILIRSPGTNENREIDKLKINSIFLRNGYVIEIRIHFTWMVSSMDYIGVWFADAIGRNIGIFKNIYENILLMCLWK